MLELEHMLTLCSTEKDIITQDTVDILIENLCNIFVTSGQKTFGTYNVKEKNKNNTFKKEFNSMIPRIHIFIFAAL
jgi:hypothetical protein